MDTSRQIVKVGMVFGKVNQDSSRQAIYDFILNPCSAKEIYMAHSLLFSSQFSCVISINTVKPVLSSHSKIDKTKTLMINGSLMKVESIAECSHWSILQYF